MVGESSRTFQYGKDRGAALADLQQAFAKVGSMVELNESTSTVVGRTRYGLQSVKLRVSVMDGPAEGTSVVTINGFGDDIWGGGARKGADKLVRALEAL
jgi:hypothetical protein